CSWVDDLDMRHVDEAIVRPPIAVEIATPPDADALLVGDTLDVTCEPCECSRVVPIDRVRRDVDRERGLGVVFRVWPPHLALSVEVHAFLLVFSAVTSYHREVDGLDRFVQNVLQPLIARP